MHVFIGLYICYLYMIIKCKCLTKTRVKLHHFQSAHDQLFQVESHRLNAFERKYGLGGPIPEGLTNYLDVRKE